MMSALRMAIRDADPKLILFDTKTMDQLLDAPLAQPRLSALLLTAFSLVALLLSAIGLYGVMSSAVRQQTRDIGVRVALGATARDVYRLVLSEAAWVIGADSQYNLGVLAARGLGTEKNVTEVLTNGSPLPPHKATRMPAANATKSLLTWMPRRSLPPSKRSKPLQPRHSQRKHRLSLSRPAAGIARHHRRARSRSLPARFRSTHSIMENCELRRLAA